ncbi:MAG: hypothetical protein HC916_00530 [Coleofasciculaceae cyanobacterium SM2_1_6]|nr:hypothetical protein [Coleofasciculaceae cyanobacterium SM2_1_6]
MTTKFGKFLGLGLMLLVVNGSMTSCGISARFPSNQVVEKAIAMQISPTYSHLSQKLSQPNPDIEISKVQVQKIVTMWWKSYLPITSKELTILP